MKYIIIDHDGRELPIIFPDILNHSLFSGWRVVSAGEVRLYGADGPIPEACCCENAIRASVSGKSTSLSQTLGRPVVSRPEDAEIIEKEVLRHYH